MTEREALDRVIEMRQQVIDGGTLFCDPATGESRSSVHDIVNRIDDFATVSRLLEKKEYNCKFHVESVAGKSEKRIPITKDDLYKRFESMKTMRVGYDEFVGTIIKWDEMCATILWANIEGQDPEDVSYDDLVVLYLEFLDGDPCWKVEE